MPRWLGPEFCRAVWSGQPKRRARSWWEAHCDFNAIVGEYEGSVCRCEVGVGLQGCRGSVSEVFKLYATVHRHPESIRAIQYPGRMAL